MLPSSVRILVCTARQDMRRSFDTLAAVVRDELHEEPQSGALFVFVGKRPTRVKVLWWDRNGYCLLGSSRCDAQPGRSLLTVRTQHGSDSGRFAHPIAS